MLRVHGLSKSFGGHPVLEELSFQVRAGEVVALVGPNGAGKTTVLRCLTGDEPPDSGQVLLDDAPLDLTLPQTRRRVCALLDDLAFLPLLSVHEHLELLARAHGTPNPTAVVDAAVEELEIDHVADQHPYTLSSGQRQRVSLAQTLVRPFDLLILDEPEQRLDRDGRAWLGGHLAALAASGVAVLIASHDPEVLAASHARLVEVDPDA